MEEDISKKMKFEKLQSLRWFSGYSLFTLIFQCFISTPLDATKGISLCFILFLPQIQL